MLEFLLLLLRVVHSSLRSRREVTLENLVLRHQLHVALRTNSNPGLRNRDRVLWVWVRLLWPKGWRKHLLVVRPKPFSGGTAKAGGCIGVGSHAPGWVGLVAAKR